MKITYETTIDEAVDVQLRVFGRSNTIKKWRRRELLGLPFVFAATYLIIPYVIVPSALGERLVFSTISGIAFLVFHFGTYKRRTRSRVRKLLIEQLGSDAPFPTEYETGDDGLMVRTLGAEIKLLWSEITEINETDGLFEVVSGKQGVAALPKRAFQNNQQESEWISFIREKTEIA